MILETISSLELKAVYIIREEEKRINTLLRIKQHLSKIDWDMEDVPLVNEDKFKSLLESLKGGPLDVEEDKGVNEILNNSGNKRTNNN